MKKVAPGRVIDITPFSEGFLYVVEDKLPDGTYKASFYSYNHLTLNTTAVTRVEYQKYKFGFAYEEIVKEIVDYIFCDVCKFSDNTVLVNSHDGYISVFDNQGKLTFDGEILYKNANLSGACVDNDTLWFAVKDKNCIINYSPLKRKILTRIGGGINTGFAGPVNIFKRDNYLYVSNSHNNSIRVFNTDTLVANGYLKFKEELKNFFKVGTIEYVHLTSGLYALDYTDIPRLD